MSGMRSKLSPYELGVRTPMFVRWPGKVPPLRDDETLASIIDFVPTILEVCGVPVPAELPSLNLLDRKAMTARQSIFLAASTHDIADLDRPAMSLTARMVIDGWPKLLLPGAASAGMKRAAAPHNPSYSTSRPAHWKPPISPRKSRRKSRASVTRLMPGGRLSKRVGATRAVRRPIPARTQGA